MESRTADVHYTSIQVKYNLLFLCLLLVGQPLVVQLFLQLRISRNFLLLILTELLAFSISQWDPIFAPRAKSSLRHIRWLEHILRSNASFL